MCLIKLYCFWREPDVWLIHEFKGCYICSLVSHTHCYFRPVIQQCTGSVNSGIVKLGVSTQLIFLFLKEAQTFKDIYHLK